MAVECSACGGGCDGCTVVDTISGVRRVVLVGNPNVGKSTVFNQITGLRQRVGNYPGVTVERKSGRINGTFPVEVVDLPGMYSLNPRSLDEEIAYKVLTGQMEGEEAPDLVVCVVDALNLERNLLLALQIMDLGFPVVVALNMVDAAEREGVYIDAKALSDELGVPVVPMSAVSGMGVDKLRAMLFGNLPHVPERIALLPEPVENSLVEAARLLSNLDAGYTPNRAYGEALRALASSQIRQYWKDRNAVFYRSILDIDGELKEQGVDLQQVEIKSRYEQISQIIAQVLRHSPEVSRASWTDRVDAVLTHPVAGPIIFLLFLLLIFQAVFSWAVPAMDAIEAGMGLLGEVVGKLLPPGLVHDLLVDGAIAGVGAVLVFLPQILLLFFFIGLMEDTGYMARAAFIADRLMSRIGLSGRSVVPLVSGYACAVPAIMATRTIENHRDRLVTMMVIPLMSCSARLPVYTLLIGAFIPATSLFGIITYQGLTLLGLYLTSTVMALIAALVLKKFVVRGEQSLFVLELPAYRMPQIKLVLWRMIERARAFVTTAGRIILFMSIVLWFLAAFPRTNEDVTGEGVQNSAQVQQVELSELSVEQSEQVQKSAQIRNSYIGRLGRAIEPVMAPLGFDWKISAGLISAFAAREVIISTLATIYSVSDADDNSVGLREKLRADIDPDTGQRVFSPLVAISLMIFIMLACQCMSTLAVTRRETNTWRWPVFMFVYMTVLAYMGSLIVYQFGRVLGLG